MSNPLDLVIGGISSAILAIYGEPISNELLTLQETKKEFEGDYTLVVFPFTKILRKKPEDIAHDLGQWLVQQDHIPVKSYNVITGFLNLQLADQVWTNLLDQLSQKDYTTP